MPYTHSLRKIPLLEDVESLTFGADRTRLIVSYEDNVSLSGLCVTEGIISDYFVFIQGTRSLENNRGHWVYIHGAKAKRS